MIMMMMMMTATWWQWQCWQWFLCHFWIKYLHIWGEEKIIFVHKVLGKNWPWLLVKNYGKNCPQLGAQIATEMIHNLLLHLFTDVKPKWQRDTNGNYCNYDDVDGGDSDQSCENHDDFDDFAPKNHCNVKYSQSLVVIIRMTLKILGLRFIAVLNIFNIHHNIRQKSLESKIFTISCSGPCDPCKDVWCSDDRTCRWDN